MNRITRFMYTFHRLTGTLLCLLFLVWFLSAFVMMYHGFPKASAGERMEKALACLGDEPSAWPGMEEVAARMPSGQRIRGITLERSMGLTLFRIKTMGGEYMLPADSTRPLPALDAAYFQELAALWCDAPVAGVDTLLALDRWLPYGQLKSELPIYKYRFADGARHELYIGSASGEVLQYTDRKERMWAWLGPIPHWVYIARLRQNTALWRKTVIGLSGIGCLMVIAGIWIGIDVWRRTRRNRHGAFCPYKKRWYRWHYITGIVFGLFVLMFVFSGMMSEVELPASPGKPAKEISPMRAFSGKAPRVETIPLDYRRVVEAYPEAKQIEWRHFGPHPYYMVKGEGLEAYVDAADSVPRPLHLSKEEILEAVEEVYRGDSLPAVTLQMELIDRFETHYRDMSRMYPGRSLLPVWKVTADDAGHSVFYIHPETGIARYVNTAARWKYWTYTALHRLRLPGLNSHVVLRKALLWVLLLGGTAVSVTGVAMGVLYVKRKIRKKR